MARNIETFARCRAVLARGGTVALFPEGRSHNEPGAAAPQDGRGAHRAGGGERTARPGCASSPSASSTRTRSASARASLVQVGEPIDPAPEQAAYAGAPRGAVKALTARIAAGLESVTLPFASWEEARLIDRAVDLAVEGDPGTLPALAALVPLAVVHRTLRGAREVRPRARAAAGDRAARYDETRRRLGLRESDLAAWPDRGWRARLRDILEFAIKAPASS